MGTSSINDIDKRNIKRILGVNTIVNVYYIELICKLPRSHLKTDMHSSHEIFAAQKHFALFKNLISCGMKVFFIHYLRHINFQYLLPECNISN